MNTRRATIRRPQAKRAAPLRNVRSLTTSILALVVLLCAANCFRGLKEPERLVDDIEARKYPPFGVPKILWGIRSDPDDVATRQAIRDTYLNSSEVCALRDAKKSMRRCNVLYAFLVSTTELPETDAIALRQGIEWLERATDLIEDLGLGSTSDTYVLFTDAHVAIWPELITHVLERKNENPYQSLHAYPKPEHRMGFAQEKESFGSVLEFGSTEFLSKHPEVAEQCHSNQQIRRLDEFGEIEAWMRPTTRNNLEGEVLIFSKDLAKLLLAQDNGKSTNTSAYSSLYDLVCKVLHRIRRYYPLGQVGTYPDAARVRREWEKMQQNRREWERWSKITTVSGKFGRVPGLFGHHSAMRRYNLLLEGFRLDQIRAMDTFPPNIIHDKKWSQHLQFLYDSNETRAPSRGGGFWFWKAQIIFDALNRADEGEFVLYGDADVLDWYGLPAALSAMVERGHNFALFPLKFPQRRWCKRDAYASLCPGRDAASDESQQYWAGHVFLRKSPGVMELVRAWVDAVANYHLLDDSPSLLPNIPEYKEHRHDQALLSLLLNCRYGDQTRVASELPRVGKHLHKNKILRSFHIVPVDDEAAN